MYTIHPTNEAIVLTPDHGCIECKHEAAALRVRDELNALAAALANAHAVITQLRKDIAILTDTTDVRY